MKKKRKETNKQTNNPLFYCGLGTSLFALCHFNLGNLAIMYICKINYSKKTLFPATN